MYLCTEWRYLNSFLLIKKSLQIKAIRPRGMVVKILMLLVMVRQIQPMPNVMDVLLSFLSK